MISTTAARAVENAWRELNGELRSYLVRRLSDPDQAEDLLMDAFLRTVAAIAEGTEVTNLKAFLYRVAHNLVVDEYRRRTRTTLVELLPHHFTVQDQALIVLAEMDEERRADYIRMALAPLSLLQRQAVAVHYWGDASHRETGQRIGANEGTVKSRITRALRTVRERVQTLYAYYEESEVLCKTN